MSISVKKLKAGDLIITGGNEVSKILGVEKKLDSENKTVYVFKLDEKLYNSIMQCHINYGVFFENGKGAENNDIIDVIYNEG